MCSITVNENISKILIFAYLCGGGVRRWVGNDAVGVGFGSVEIGCLFTSYILKCIRKKNNVHKRFVLTRRPENESKCSSRDKTRVLRPEQIK